MFRRGHLAAFILLGTASGAVAQRESPVSFEVASIRHIEYTDQVRDEVLSGSRRPRMVVTDGRVSITYMSLTEILRSAFRVEPWALSGPDWLDEMRFDIQATIPHGVKTDQAPEMLQSLLARRFGLVTRRESREVSGHALVTRGTGVKVREMTGDELSEMARQRETAKFEARTIRTERSTLTFTPLPDGLIQADIKGPVDDRPRTGTDIRCRQARRRSDRPDRAIRVHPRTAGGRSPATNRRRHQRQPRSADQCIRPARTQFNG